MPIWEYKCDGCGESFTALFTAAGRDEGEKALRCPECGGASIKRLLSSFSVGSGAPSKNSTPPPCAGGGGCIVPMAPPIT